LEVEILGKVREAMIWCLLTNFLIVLKIKMAGWTAYAARWIQPLLATASFTGWIQASMGLLNRIL
jgi:hypothetical protein